MSTDSILSDIAPPPDDAIAALMASPGFQPQMAALTQQAVASLQALVASLAQFEGQAPPPKPPAIIDTPAPPVDDALAALMATPEYQAQMAALTQQATASLKTLVSGLAEAGGQLSAPSEKLAPPIIDIPYGLAVEPMFLPWSSVPPGPDGSPVLVGPPVFRMALEPSPEELAVDMLSALPQAAAVSAWGVVVTVA